MKDFLKKILKNKMDQRSKLNNSLVECEDKEERKSIVTAIATLDEEIRECETQIADLEAREAAEAQETEQRGGQFDPSQALNIQTTPMNNQQRSEENPLASMEYRTAFMNYVQRGEVSDVLKAQMEKRDTADQIEKTDLGILIPETIIQKIISGVEHVYGQLYSRVRKTNIKGGVKYPIGSFNATFHRITETTVSVRQAGSSVGGSVVFGYKIGEIRIAQTLLANVLTVPAFEEELANTIVKAYLKAMDTEIMVGTEAANQMVGILTEANNAAQSTSRFYGLTDHIIEFTEADMADWATWQKKLFAKIPLSMRGLNPEFAMTANTYESNIKTLKDDNNRPVYNETYNPVDGAEISRFKGKDVVFVENDILGDFDDISVAEGSTDSPYFGMYWVPEEAYAINTNLEFFVKRYFDEETNQYVDKALVINDGKILDPKYIYLLKKVAPTA